MPNLHHHNILRLGKAIITSDVSKTYTIRHLKEFHSTNSRLGENQSYGFSPEQNCHEQSFNEGQSNKSSSYQDHHRRGYERKRSFYERERKKSGNSERTNYFSFSTGTNHYERLNLDPTADAAAIKSAYYNLSKQYHPDIAGNENAQAAEQFRLITESYDVLSDPPSRADYDKSLNLVPTNSESIWKPNSNRRDNDGNFNSIYRMRQADQVFRFKQEEALEREKRLNPRKFRAGSFSSADGDDSDPSERLAILERRMQNLGGTMMRGSGDINSSDFYRAHLYEIMQRRKEGIQAVRAQQNQSGPSGADSSMVLPMIATLIAGIILFSGISALFIDFEVADYLDSQVKVKKRKINNIGEGER